MTNIQLEKYLENLVLDKKDQSIYSVQVFLYHKKSSFRQIAVKCLRSFSYDKISDYLLPLLSNDKSSLVKKEVVKTLLYDQEELAKNFFKEFIKTNKDEKLNLFINKYLKKDVTKDEIFSVSKFIDDINLKIDTDIFKVEGEISSLQISHFGQNQWIFFDLKDEFKQAKIRCFTTIYTLRKSRVSPVDGMKVILTGNAKISSKSGLFSLNVSFIQISGEGELLKSFELLKKKLELEGLFDSSRKRKLPYLPTKIGLITSRDAAAYQDFLKVLNQRIGGLDIFFSHSQVQGEKAVETIIESIERLNSYPEIEVIILTRGGGSMDDLHAFNDEALVRAIFSSKKPVLVAVGHERDFTIVDYVADLRASTPSNAAELLVPTKVTLLEQIDNFYSQVYNKVVYNIEKYNSKIFVIQVSLEKVVDRIIRDYNIILRKYQNSIFRFKEVISSYKVKLQIIHDLIENNIVNQISSYKDKVRYINKYIEDFNPTKLLKIGFSLTRLNKKILSDIDKVKIKDTISVDLYNGKLFAEVIKKEKYES